jgi:preprotein translocase subunit SecG
MIETLTLVLHMLVAVGIIVLVLLQHGRGADMGAAFGSGSSGSLFGSAGSANFLSRTTAILATVFFVSSVALTYFGSQRGEPEGVIRPGSAPAQQAPGPAAPSDIPPAPSGAPASAPTPAAAPAPAAPAGAQGAGADAAGGATPASRAGDIPK